MTKLTRPLVETVTDNVGCQSVSVVNESQEGQRFYTLECSPEQVFIAARFLAKSVQVRLILPELGVSIGSVIAGESFGGYMVSKLINPGMLRRNSRYGSNVRSRLVVVSVHEKPTVNKYTSFR
jgi:hypothetical protein